MKLKLKLKLINERVTSPRSDEKLSREEREHALKLMMRTMSHDHGGLGFTKNESKRGTHIDVLLSQLSSKSRTPNTTLNCTHCNVPFLF
ncbi:unnamed protein product, partial [Prunus brigantina]